MPRSPRRWLLLTVVALGLVPLHACTGTNFRATAHDVATWVATPHTTTGNPLLFVQVRRAGLGLARQLPNSELAIAPRVRPGDPTVSGFAARAFDALLPALDWPPLAPAEVAIARQPPSDAQEVHLGNGTAVRMARHYPIPIGERAITVARATGKIVAQSYDVPIDAVPTSVLDRLEREQLGAIRRATVELEHDSEQLRLELGTGTARRIVRCRMDGSELQRFRLVSARLWAPLPRPRRSAELASASRAR